MMADDIQPKPATPDKINASLGLDAALKTYREAWGAERYLERLKHAVNHATLAVAAETHGAENARR